MELFFFVCFARVIHVCPPFFFHQKGTAIVPLRVPFFFRPLPPFLSQAEPHIFSAIVVSIPSPAFLSNYDVVGFVTTDSHFFNIGRDCPPQLLIRN